jgi:DNA-directed RNA polymerase specialized sigma24 family protein
LTIGEEAKFSELVQRQSGFVLRVAYAVLLNRADAEDGVKAGRLWLCVVKFAPAWAR